MSCVANFILLERLKERRRIIMNQRLEGFADWNPLLKILGEELYVLPEEEIEEIKTELNKILQWAGEFLGDNIKEAVENFIEEIKSLK